MITIYGLNRDAYETAVDAIGSGWFDDIVVTEIGLDVRLSDNVRIEYSFGTLNIIDGTLETAFDELDFAYVKID